MEFGDAKVQEKQNFDQFPTYSQQPNYDELQKCEQQPTNNEQQIVNSDRYKELKCQLMINEKNYPLNKSKSKWLSIGLAARYNYEPAVKLYGYKGQTVILSEIAWMKLCEYQGIIMNYFYTNSFWDPIITPYWSVNFEIIHGKKVVRISGYKGNEEIYFALDTLCNIGEMMDIVKYRMKVLKSQNFQHFYSGMLMRVSRMDGEMVTNLINEVTNEQNSYYKKSYENNPMFHENLASTLEMLHYHKDVIIYDFVTAKRQ